MYTKKQFLKEMIIKIWIQKNILFILMKLEQKSLTDNLWDIQVNRDYFKAKHKLEEQVIYDILNGYEGEKYE